MFDLLKERQLETKCWDNTQRRFLNDFEEMDSTRFEEYLHVSAIGIRDINDVLVFETDIIEYYSDNGWETGLVIFVKDNCAYGILKLKVNGIPILTGETVVINDIGAENIEVIDNILISPDYGKKG